MSSPDTAWHQAGQEKHSLRKRPRLGTTTHFDPISLGISENQISPFLKPERQ
jgi:hypothetical protein